jgi:iron only hydrogenase large subunit-like protein/PAS domain-containing protein
LRQNTIYTVTANCQDCYRCVRACPVKAIRVSGGQAQIEDARCIKCGTCVRECPQRAKTIQSSLDEVKVMVRAGRTVAASIAPSFAGLWNGKLTGRLPSALRRLGFRHAAETAEGAKYITEKSLNGRENGCVCTACPAVVNYIEKYKPDMLDTLIPVVSPMVAHGRMLKSRYPGCAVVFIGPCAAKKQEALRPENADAIDAVLTFAELTAWLEDENIRLENCSESGFDTVAEIGDSRLFPLQGGMLKTGGILSDGTNPDVLHLSGAEEVMGLFESGKRNWRYRYIEPLFCKGGCIGGPAFAGDQNLFERRSGVIAYADEKKSPDAAKAKAKIVFQAVFSDETRTQEEVTESQINIILERTGKVDPAFQLNCGACGYRTCRENAVAVARGMAEPEMCMPYMRRLAQQRTDRVIETTPNGIVVLNSELCMIQMNPAFQKMFMCNNGILGRRISYLVNAEGYERMLTGETDSAESIQSKYGIRYHEILYALRDEGQYVGIYSDISKIKYDEGQLDTIKAQTLLHAREFLEHQVRFAQEMAHYLGKSTAQSEEIAKRLIALYEQDPGAQS